MLEYLTTEEKSRFAQLQSRLAQLVISDAEQTELRSLVAKAQSAANARQQAVETVRRLIAENHIAPQELFAQWANPKTPAKRSSKAPAQKTSKRSEQVLIQVKLDKGPGAPSRYKMGQKLGKVVSGNFKQLDVGGQLVENLLKYATPLGQRHFATPQGRAELDRFAEFVRQTPMAK